MQFRTIINLVKGKKLKTEKKLWETNSKFCPFIKKLNPATSCTNKFNFRKNLQNKRVCSYKSCPIRNDIVKETFWNKQNFYSPEPKDVTTIFNKSKTKDI